MKKIMSLVLSLTAISAVCAGVLAYVDSITREPIKATAAVNEQKAIMAVLPPGTDKIEAAARKEKGKVIEG